MIIYWQTSENSQYGIQIGSSEQEIYINKWSKPQMDQQKILRKTLRPSLSLIEERYARESRFLFSKLRNEIPLPIIRQNVILQIYFNMLIKKSNRLHDKNGLYYMFDLTGMYLSIIDEYNLRVSKLPF